jgi:hypothetical protein
MMNPLYVLTLRVSLFPAIMMMLFVILVLDLVMISAPALAVREVIVESLIAILFAQSFVVFRAWMNPMVVVIVMVFQCPVIYAVVRPVMILMRVVLGEFLSLPSTAKDVRSVISMELTSVSTINAMKVMNSAVSVRSGGLIGG